MARVFEHQMREKIGACIKQADKIINRNREAALRPADSVAHHYDDKYLLADHICNSALVCVLHSFELLGLSRAEVARLQGWSADRCVSLRYAQILRCQFVRETEREIEVLVQRQPKGKCKGPVKATTKVKEYTYSMEVHYKVEAFTGVGDNSQQKMTVTERTCQREVTTRSSSAPFRETSSWDASETSTSTPRPITPPFASTAPTPPALRPAATATWRPHCSSRGS
jgi:predicted transcriptional regulator